MEDWIANNIFELITAAIAIYAAGLSTAQFAASRTDKKIKLKVTTTHGFITYTNGEAQRHILGTASNTGHRDIQIKGYSLKREDGHQYFNPNNTSSNPPIPCILKPGEQISVWFNHSELASSLTEEGIKQMEVRASFHDGTNQTFVSKKAVILKGATAQENSD